MLSFVSSVLLILASGIIGFAYFCGPTQIPFDKVIVALMINLIFVACINLLAIREALKEKSSSQLDYLSQIIWPKLLEIQRTQVKEAEDNTEGE